MAATPLLGDVFCNTVAPFVGEAMAPSVLNKMFAPQGVRAAVSAGPRLRPSQIHAYAEDRAQMTPAAAALSPRYGSLFPPTVIMAGNADKIVSHRQAQRLLRR